MSFLEKDSLRTEHVVLSVMHKPPLMSSISRPPEEGGGAGGWGRRKEGEGGGGGRGGFLMESLTNEWVKTVYTMEFHSVIKNKVMHLAAK